MSTDTLSESSTHEGPHILSVKGDQILDWSVGDFPITTTIISTWFFMMVLFLIVGLFYYASRTNRLPRVRATGMDIVKRLYDYAFSLLGNAGMAHEYIWLLGGVFLIVLFGNLFGLVLDFLSFSIPSLQEYVRPVFSDLSGPLFLSLAIVLIAQFNGIARKGFTHHFGHYLFNFRGSSFIEKVVNVFVGWLHFVGEFIRVGSLSMRLFLNILVGAILISIIIYIGGMIPSFGTNFFSFLALPFWFFELLVAFLQAYIFMTLSSLYLKESLPDDSHA